MVIRAQAADDVWLRIQTLFEAVNLGLVRYAPQLQSRGPMPDWTRENGARHFLVSLAMLQADLFDLGMRNPSLVYLRLLRHLDPGDTLGAIRDARMLGVRNEEIEARPAWAL